MHRVISAERIAKALSQSKVRLELLEGDGFTTVGNPEKVAKIVSQFIGHSAV